MPLQEFRIEFDNPSRSYFPGQNVTGRVILALQKEQGTQGLKIKFEGRVKVHWSEHVTERHNGESRSVTKNYNAHENIVDFKMYAVGTGSSDIKIPPGRYIYPFNFALPPMNLPSSFVGAHGSVSYEVEATVKRSWKFDHVIKEPVTINAIVDLNKTPGISEPTERRKEKRFCCLCCTSGPLGFLIKLPRTGFVPGEYLSPTVEVYNQSSKRIKELSMKLSQDVIFLAEGKRKLSSNTLTSISREGLGPGVSDIWQGQSLQIPPVPPTKLGGCHIIQVDYTLKCEAHVSGIAFNLKTSLPITIGTIPFTSTFSELSFQNTAHNNAVAIGGGNFMQSGEIAPYPSAPSPFKEYNTSHNFPPGGPVIGDGKTAPPYPNPFYPGMPPQSFNTSFDQGQEMKQPLMPMPDNSGSNLPPGSNNGNFAPNYVTYGWNMPGRKE